MANTRAGGVIVFGVEDATREPVGLTEPGETIDVALRAACMLKPALPIADTLLTQGLSAMRLAEGQAVRADTDTGNWPIQQALERAGFQPTAAHWDYQRPLQSLL